MPFFAHPLRKHSRLLTIISFLMQWRNWLANKKNVSAAAAHISCQYNHNDVCNLLRRNTSNTHAQVNIYDMETRVAGIQNLNLFACVRSVEGSVIRLSMTSGSFKDEKKRRDFVFIADKISRRLRAAAAPCPASLIFII